MVVYKYYKSTFGGCMIPEQEWTYYEHEAQQQLKYYRRIYIVSVPEGDDADETEQSCICALAELLKVHDILLNGDSGLISNAKIGSVSISYDNSSAIDVTEKGRKKALYETAKKYFDIYRGADR